MSEKPSFLDDACPEFLRPRLRLFLSADIVGSTALKQSPMNRANPGKLRDDWFTKIQGFYFESQDAFISECEEAHREDTAFGELPNLWKTVGDEVIFTKTLTSHHQLIQALYCWERAIQRMRRFIKKGDHRLDVKSTAWLAGFPFRNAEVVTSAALDYRGTGDQDWFLESADLIDKYHASGGGNNIDVDYIGPSIDIGFRLSSFASSRKFIISVDIAFILSIANPKRDKFNELFQVYYDGAVPLKGVLGGVNYPIFWLDFSDKDSLDRFEDGIAEKKFVNRDELRKYCGRFFEEFDRYIFPPFIVGSEESELDKIPDWYETEHSKLLDKYREMLAEREERAKSILDDPPADSTKGEADPESEERLVEFLDQRGISEDGG